MWNRIPIERCPGQVGVCYPLDCRPGLSGNIGLTLTRSCPTADSLISSLATLNEVPYGKRQELPPVVFAATATIAGSASARLFR